jgi:hypothetical protein
LGQTSGCIYHSIIIARHSVYILSLSLVSMLLQIFAHATSHPNGKDVPNARACKYSLNTLMNIFQSKSLPANISEEGIRELVSVLLMRILDATLPNLSEGSSMLKAVNVLMLKVLPCTYTGLQSQAGIN